MVWPEIIVGSHTGYHIFPSGTVTLVRYRDGITGVGKIELPSFFRFIPIYSARRNDI